ncbi:ankyrin repeat domain-containing protein [Chryseobacterium taiwanense]|uniref:Uncharacterized protein n=1 Tax=Chryseobacterium taiwanense TaxID=363331 RepID=A0A0B4DIG7_9FLAO|nr:ankyrin repeat domain-containing protein [Chryseobacterium taiwanense]KIC64200.1 hypothetical protein RM51_05675 [Chryseobacterium taiwanense]
MKKIISTTFVFLGFLFANLFSAQEISKQQMLVFQSDNVDTFKAAFPKDDYNKCLALKENSFSLLSLSIKHDKKNIFNYLVSNEADLNKACDNQTPLMVAARYGKSDFAKELIKKGANKSLKNEKGETAKDFSAKYNHPEIASILK